MRLQQQKADERAVFSHLPQAEYGHVRKRLPQIPRWDALPQSLDAHPQRVLLEDRLQQFLLGAEVVIEEALRRLQLEGDVVHARTLVPPLREDPKAGVQDSPSRSGRALAPQVKRPAERGDPADIHVPGGALRRKLLEADPAHKDGGRRTRAPSRQTRIAVSAVSYQGEIVGDRSRRYAEFGDHPRLIEDYAGAPV